MAHSAQINPRSAEHRTLKFRTLDEAVAEAERLAAADRAGTLRTTGNWSLGQTLGHIAFWINTPFDGYPPCLRPPWILRFILRRRRNMFLRGPMPRGVRIPKFPEGTLGTEPLSTDEGLARFRKAAARLKAAPPANPNIILGPLTHDEWIAMNLNHAALHLGYMHEC